MTKLVAILNLSPDSFSDGRSYTIDELRERIQELIDDGADIIDVGAESTAPGSLPIDAQEELSRLSDFFSLLQEFPETVFSLDTTKSFVAHEWIKHGVKMINDVSWGRADPMMFDIVAEEQIPIVIMYAKNDSWRADKEDRDDEIDIIEHIKAFFHERLYAAYHAWIQPHQIILDPGMWSFISPNPQDSKKVLQSLPLLIQEFQLPLYIGTSRKGFLGKRTSDRWPKDRVWSSLWSALYAYWQGASYLRVHDLRRTKQLVDTRKELYR